MMYHIIRYILTLIIFIIFLVLFCKKKINKKTFLSLLFVCLFLPSIFGLLPVEKYFLKFNTSEAAFRYVFPKDEIVQTIPLENSELFIYKDSDDDIRYINIIKKNNNWVTSGEKENFEKRVILNKTDAIYIFKVKSQSVIIIREYMAKDKNIMYDVKDNINSIYYSLTTKQKNTNLNIFMHYTILDEKTKNIKISFDNRITEINLDF